MPTGVGSSFEASGVPVLSDTKRRTPMTMPGGSTGAAPSQSQARLVEATLWSVAGALAVAIGWMLVPACGVRVPFGEYVLGRGSYCKGVADPRIAQGVQALAMEIGKMAPLEEKLRNYAATCVLPPPPRADPPEPDPRDELRQVLEDRGLRPDETGTSITLLWNNWNDLDLYLVCPDGSATGPGIGKGNNCAGSKNKIDENWTETPNPVDHPVEYITAAKGALKRGRYQVRVNYFHNRRATPVKTDYEVIVQRGSEYERYSKTTSRPTDNPHGYEIAPTVAEFDVP
ncbi:hypothetical protein K9B32_16440 [Rhizobium sp. 3T7]|uniref:hypothetical protein n=1 Tax=Rhizobium sp. 3T7 TaxID=2874922 RepID=UPI001CCB98D6|nr:hypothetical protein [Rhizobium sp. 3T7]MBZ9791695.1 hypothetical protein [Rhizobium sp. 3T7]